MQTFISYRHADSDEVTQQQIYPVLVEKLGACGVFMDRVGVRPGEPFPEKIRKALETSYSVLVIIGPRWSGTRESGGRSRLWDEADYVRTEVALALRWKLKVYPVLLHQQEMPKSGDLPPDMRKLAEIKAFEVRDLAGDIGKLADELVDLRTKVRRCAGVEWRHRCRRFTPNLLCGKHSRQLLCLLALLGLTTVGGFAWREQGWMLAPVRAAVPSPPPLSIVAPRDSATAGSHVVVRGTSPFRGQPHYVVVSAGQERYVVDRPIDLAWNGSWHATVPLGSGTQGIGQWFGIQVLTARADLSPGPLVANPPGARASPAVSVFRSH